MSSEIVDKIEQEILTLDTRKKIYDLVTTFAGLHFREIERNSGLSTGVVRYHLHYLSKHGLIKEEKENNHLRYFPRFFTSENKKLLSLLRQKSVRNMLICMMLHNPCYHGQLVNFIRLSPSTVSWHLKRLEEEKVISIIKKRGKTSYNLMINKDEIMKLLITYQQTFFDTLVDNVVEMWSVK